jgi:hypothetical protein
MTRTPMSDARERPDRQGLEPAQMPVADGERHHRPDVDVAGAVGDGRAVEVEAMPVARLDLTGATLIVETRHRSHDRPGVPGWCQ